MGLIPTQLEHREQNRGTGLCKAQPGQYLLLPLSCCASTCSAHKAGEGVQASGSSGNVGTAGKALSETPLPPLQTHTAPCQPGRAQCWALRLASLRPALQTAVFTEPLPVNLRPWATKARRLLQSRWWVQDPLKHGLFLPHLTGRMEEDIYRASREEGIH